MHLLMNAVLAIATICHAASVERQNAIRWGACEFKHRGWPVEKQCGTLTVPMDYSNETNGATLELDLIRIAATHQPSQGSMIFNPGGPGESAVSSLVVLAQSLQIVAGGQYDLVAFDPRGTGRTLPVICNATNVKRDDRFYTGDSAQIVGERLPEYMKLAETCGAALENGPFYGTVFVARDMLQVVDALGEDGMLRYYGVSYGTVLGFTFAQLFPDRVDRMLLDANVSPVE